MVFLRRFTFLKICRLEKAKIFWQSEVVISCTFVYCKVIPAKPIVDRFQVIFLPSSSGKPKRSLRCNEARHSEPMKFKYFGAHFNCDADGNPP